VVAETVDVVDHAVMRAMWMWRGSTSVAAQLD
jgi:hypothetical protein